MSQTIMIENTEWRWVLIVSILLLFMISIPFMWAYAVAVPDAHFVGVLVNPIDGASYQAKMYQGMAGSWQFHLPYTPEPHRGVFLFIFYLGLGHLARALNLPLILVFHAARLVGSMIMFLAIYEFMSDWTGNVGQRRIAWGLAVVGSGFGWLASALGHVTPDLLILPEAFPLQAAYANAHFPWAIAVGVWIAHTLSAAALFETDRWPALDSRTVGLALASLMMVGTAPFMLLPIGIGFGVLCLRLWHRRRSFPRRELAWGLVVLIFATPLAAYNIWAYSAANPVMHGWMQQNRTPSPPVWEYLVAFGPLLVLALVGLWGSRRLLDEGDIFLLSWLVGMMILLYVPFNLQRRFAMGLTVPLAVYAARGLCRVVAPLVRGRWQQILTLVGFSVFVPTTALAIVLPLVGTLDAEQGYPYFVSQEEQAALDWLEGQTEPDALILASPEFSLYIPGRGRRVVYGHPFETLQPARREQAVDDFYSGADCSVVDEEGVDYVLVGPRERALTGSGEMCPLSGEAVFRSQQGEVLIYAARDR
jgi:hypothetical protein